jgi:predicted nucleic acid-binding protein
MLVALDTSILVAGVLEGHAFHARARIWQQAIHRGELEAMVCAHALAELYSVLTKLPNGLTPAEANVVASNIRRRVRVVVPTLGTYLAAIERCSSRSLRSGAVYDALHLIEAERAGASMLLTFNPDDFVRLAEGERLKIVVPPDPPSIDVTGLTAT